MTARLLAPYVLALLAMAPLACGGSAAGTVDGGGLPESGRATTEGGRSDGSTLGKPVGARDAGPDSVSKPSPALEGGVVEAGSVDAATLGDAWTFAPTIPIGSLEQNNTSACSSDAGPCASAWSQTHSVTYSSGSSYAGKTRNVSAFWDNPVPAGSQAPGSTLGYVSKVPVSALLPGQNVPIWIETQNWWGGGGGHITNGEVSSNAGQMTNQVADHISRGFSGQVVDWYGAGTTADLGLPAVMAAAEASGGAYKFAVMVDKALFVWGCGETVTCLNDSLSYLEAHYTSSPAYLKDANGKAIVFFFVNSYYPTEYGILTGPGVIPGNTVFEMYEPNGFPGNDPANTIGEYGWVNPADGAGFTTTTGAMGSFTWETDFGLKGLTSYLSAAGNNPTAFVVSEAFKGFDDNLANWSLNRVIDQRCGQTWLETFNHTGTFGGSASYLGNLNYLQSGKRLDFVMVDTWDDYEEGSEIETGIDNCLSSLTVALTGSVLSWTPTWGADPMNAAVSGSEATVYEYSVYAASPGGASVTHVTDVACSNGACPHSLDLATTPLRGGPFVFYVQAVGQPSIVNHLAGPTTASFSSP